MSTPMVVGAAAIVFQQDLTLTAIQVKNLILNDATMNIINGATITGGGKNLLYTLIDISSTSSTLSPTLSPPIPVPVPVPINSPSRSSNTTVQSPTIISLLLTMLIYIFVYVM